MKNEVQKKHACSIQCAVSYSLDASISSEDISEGCKGIFGKDVDEFRGFGRRY